MEKKLITEILNELMINNEKDLSKVILSYLDYKCERCNCSLFNKEPINSEGKYICRNCVNNYIFCVHNNCDKLKHYSELYYYQVTNGWKCKKHQRSKSVSKNL